MNKSGTATLSTIRRTHTYYIDRKEREVSRFKRYIVQDKRNFDKSEKIQRDLARKVSRQRGKANEPRKVEGNDVG